MDIVSSHEARLRPEAAGGHGLELNHLDAGCCGMAGAWGYEKDSMAIGERALLPAVRQADDEALIVADGFSCRSQITEGTKRHALHLAEVIQLALHQDEVVGRDNPQEDQIRQLQPPELRAPAAAGLTGWLACCCYSRRP